MNSTIHVNEQTSQTYTINLGSAQPKSNRPEAEQVIALAEEAVSKAKSEGRIIYLDKAESLLQTARRALSEENYGQAILSADEAYRTADSAVTWLVIPAVITLTEAILFVGLFLYRRAKRNKP